MGKTLRYKVLSVHRC